VTEGETKLAVNSVVMGWAGNVARMLDVSEKTGRKRTGKNPLQCPCQSPISTDLSRIAGTTSVFEKLIDANLFAAYCLMHPEGSLGRVASQAKSVTLCGHICVGPFQQYCPPEAAVVVSPVLKALQTRNTSA
jgi:hypothetical protein